MFAILFRCLNRVITMLFSRSISRRSSESCSDFLANNSPSFRCDGAVVAVWFPFPCFSVNPCLLLASIAQRTTVTRVLRSSSVGSANSVGCCNPIRGSFFNPLFAKVNRLRSDGVR